MEVKLVDISDPVHEVALQLGSEAFGRLDDRFEIVSVNCQLKLKREGETIHLTGDYNAKIQASCDQCLEKAEISQEGEMDLELVPESQLDQPQGDIELTLDSRDIDTYDGQTIVLNTYIEDQLILDLPLAVTCSDDCQGRCSQCGQNFNQGTCDCNEYPDNNPFRVLKSLMDDSTENQ